MLREDISVTRTETLLAKMVLLFPTIYIWFSIIGGNNNMRVFYFLYSISLILLIILNRKRKIDKELGILFGFVFVKLLYDAFCYPDSLSDAIEFGILLIILEIVQKKEVRKKFYLVLKNEQAFLTVIYILYIIGVGVTFINGTGITNRWGTFSVQGPYGLAHIFAYELLVLTVNSYLAWKLSEKTRWIVFFAIFFVLMVLTNVRTVLLAIVIAIGYIFLMNNGLRKFLYAIVILFLGYVVFRFTPLFTFVIRKTINAIDNGSVTNYRYEIWRSSFQHFLSQPLRFKFLGSGINTLMEWNVRNVRMLIQAHNDFLTVLDAFGLCSLLAYFYYLIKASKKNGGMGFFVFLLVLIMFNGMYSYCSLVLGLVSIRLFFDLSARKINKKILSS